ncbi:hypothetical protein STRTUCAR8_04160 [Streptomyces turgidiscabies Car8]|uniref:Uncharacterized protein n=1 Tax=Streptomyces turgidiscabies (strain Car8) TaxID=698760 RepID=L7F2N6_STRT8|nr:hypothetical protein STRTUCAR8_04160 [Streptomyces turgidiscabies Car8]
MKETSEKSRITGKFLPVKGAHHNARWPNAPERGPSPAHRRGRAGDGRLPAAGGLERVRQRSQPAARPTPRSGDSSGSRAGWTGRDGDGFPDRGRFREVGTGVGGGAGAVPGAAPAARGSRSGIRLPARRCSDTRNHVNYLHFQAS